MGIEPIASESIDGSFVPRAKPGVAGIELDGEGLLYDESGSSWHLLNPTAMVIWQFCDGTGTVEELANDLAEAYQTDPVTVLTGTIDTVRQLGQLGLLEGVEPSPVEIQGSHAHDRQPHHHEHEGPDDGPRFLPVPPSS
jgi:hypothetical protein